MISNVTHWDGLLTMRSPTCAIEKCSRAGFLCINTIFSLSGASMLIASCIVRYDQNTTDKYLDYSSFKMAMQSANVSAHIPTSLNMGETLNIICIVFIVIGVFFLLIGVLGIIGAVYKVKALLVTYAVLLLVLVLLELICVVLLTTIGNKIEGWIKESLKDSIRDDYVGINGNDTATLRWNFIMHSFKCCGVENAADFNIAKKWNPNKRDDGIVLLGKRLPYACCKIKNDANCVRDPKSQTAYIDKGCYRALRDWLADKTGILAGIGASVLAIELILVVLVFIMCCTLGKRADVDDNDDKAAIQTYWVPRAQFRPRNPNLFYPSNLVYGCSDNSVEIYPPRSFREWISHNTQPIDAYYENRHDQDRYMDSLSPNQYYGETFQGVPSRTPFTSLHSNEVQRPKPGKEKKKRTAVYGILCYCGGPPSECS